VPLSKYFKGKGEAVMESMQEQYGADKGKQVFYATANKSGMKPKKKRKRKLIGEKAEVY
jgi:hypothetical protein